MSKENSNNSGSDVSVVAKKKSNALVENDSNVTTVTEGATTKYNITLGGTFTNTFVSLDEKGKPQQITDIIPESSDEKRRYKEGVSFWLNCCFRC